MKKLLIITIFLTAFAEIQTTAGARSLVALVPAAARNSAVALNRKHPSEIALGSLQTVLGFQRDLLRLKKLYFEYIESLNSLERAEIELNKAIIAREIACIKTRTDHARTCSNATRILSTGFRWLFGAVAATVGFVIAKDTIQEKAK